jgi:hypothetical protein
LLAPVRLALAVLATFLRHALRRANSNHFFGKNICPHGAILTHWLIAANNLGTTLTEMSLRL